MSRDSSLPGPFIVFVLTSIVFIVIIGLRSGGVFRTLEFKFYDKFLIEQAENGLRDSRIILIGIDENDFHLWGWPLSDKLLNRLLEKVIAAKPRVIGIDLYRDKPIPWYADKREYPEFRKLNQTLKSHKNIIGVMQFGKIDPAPGLIDTDRIGFNDLLPDLEGIVRRGLLFLNDDKGHIYTSFPLKMALAYLHNNDITMQPDPVESHHLRLGKVTVKPFKRTDGAYVSADDRGYQYLLDYSGFPKGISRLSLNQVLSTL